MAYFKIAVGLSFKNHSHFADPAIVTSTVHTFNVPLKLLLVR